MLTNQKQREIETDEYIADRARDRLQILKRCRNEGASGRIFMLRGPLWRVRRRD
jgi:hypothetical protein